MGSLSEAQHSIIVGSLLGDGAMRCKTNALLEINHSVAQADYVAWKYEQLSSLVRTPPKTRVSNGGRVACRFVTRSLPELTPYYVQFYRTGRKAVENAPALTPLALAVWLMDGGCRSRTSVYLNTQQFDSRSQHILLAALLSQFGLRGSLNRDRCYTRIRIAVDSVAKLLEAVRPHMRPELMYKLPQ